MENKNRIRRFEEGISMNQDLQLPSDDNTPNVLNGPKIEINGTNMKKLDMNTISELKLPKSDRAMITSAVKTNYDGSTELIYLLKTSESSVFILPESNPYLQELQSVAANAAIDAMEMLSPIEAAIAIKKAIGEYGPAFEGGILDALKFAKDALVVSNEFQTEQLKSVQINVMQSATRQLQKDQNLPFWSWAGLPAHRKHAASIVTEMALASAMESLITGNTVQAANNMREISVSMAERTAALQKIFVENYRDMALGVAKETADKSIELIGNILSTGGQKTYELSQVLLKVIFGQKLEDEGAVKALLEKSGDAGIKLLELWEKSGLSLNKFLGNLFSPWDRKEKSDNSPKPKSK